MSSENKVIQPPLYKPFFAMPKKIAIVIQDLKGNGAERVAINLAIGLTNLGHECHIFNFRDKVELPVPPSVKRHVFPVKKFKFLPKTLRYRIISTYLDRFIISQIGKPHLVLSNLMNVDRIMQFSKLNVYTILHNTISSEHLKNSSPSERITKLKFLSKIYTAHPCVAVSKGVEEDYQNLFPSNQGVRTIYNPLDIQTIKESADLPSPLLKKLKKQEYFIHVGKFNQAKRQDKLLHAYAQSNISTPLVLVGQGPLLEKTKQLAQQLNIENRIIFAGFQENPYPLLKNAKCFVLSSDYEGLPTVLLESICLGTPAISTDCPSGPNEILPQKNLAPPDSSELLADLIKKADDNPQLYRVSLASQFTLDTAAQSYASLCL